MLIFRKIHIIDVMCFQLQIANDVV